MAGAPAGQAPAAAAYRTAPQQYTNGHGANDGEHDDKSDDKNSHNQQNPIMYAAR